MKVMTFKTALAAALLASVGLTACTSGSSVSWDHLPNKTVLSPLHHDSSVDSDDLAKAKKLSTRPYSFQLVRFHDRRTPQAKSPMVKDGVIYEYMPDKVLRGVESYMGSALKRFLTFGPEQEESYRMEYELRQLRTYISTGDFVTGPFGKYKAELVADVIVRDKDSRVILRDSMSMAAFEKRRPSNGQHPSAKADAQAVDKLMRKLIRKMAIHSAWKVHKKVKSFKRPEIVNHDDEIWEESTGDW